MSQEQQDSNIVQPLAEAQRLLDGRLWHTGNALWVQGQKVAIFLNPRPTKDVDRLDVAVTLRALEGSTKSLEGASLFLKSHGHNSGIRTYRERLNKHGLAVFRGVEKGSYQPTLTPQNSTVSLVYRQVLGLVADLQRAFGKSFSWYQSPRMGFAADDSTRAEQTYLSQDKSLKATLHSDGRNLLLRFQTSDDRWNGGILPFTWIALGPESDEVPALIDQLANRGADTGDRIAAALRMAEIGGTEAVKALENAANDPDSDVRVAAGNGLRNFELRTRFFTVLAWDEKLYGSYVSEVNLGPKPDRCELSLPESAFGAEALAPSMIPIIQKSIDCALTERHDRMAWHKLLEQENLPHRIRNLIEDTTGPGLRTDQS